MFSVALNLHDHNTYNGTTHIQAERFSRIKKNLYPTASIDFYQKEFYPRFSSVDEPLAFTYTAGAIKKIKNPFQVFEKDIHDYNQSVSHLWDYMQNDRFYYINHHQSHAAYSFLSSGFSESDILAIDGGGIDYCCMFFTKDGKVINLSNELQLGWLWNYTCLVINLKTTDSGKLMGLVGYGKFDPIIYNAYELLLEEAATNGKFYKRYDILKGKKEDIACTLQQFTLDKIKEYIFPLKTCENICLSGGVTYNGYMNEYFTTHYNNVFVPPAVGDEGQAVGTYMHADYMLNQTIHVPSVYAGKEYDLEDNEIDYHAIAKAIADGKIIGWFQGRSESGNRALGNRSILADPRNPNIKDIINNRIKKREDWRPFAPSVLEEHYQDYFDTRLTSPYMSRIVKVKSNGIPGVTHVDGTSRIQTVTQSQNEKYYKLISAFYDITGIPLLLNTSFNCQEPIVETPEDAIKTFNNTELDLVVIGSKILCK
jgi:carbamoyltransferase